MSEALTADPVGPQTDTLVEQTDAPRPAEVKVDETQRKTLDETLKAEVDRAVEGDKPEPKEKPEAKVPDDAAKVADKPEAKPKVEPKAEVEDDTDDDDPVTLKEPTQDKPDPKPSAYKEPPSGFDDAAKKEWDATPESVRGAMNRRFQEMERGLHQHKQTAQEYEPLRKYADMAKESGTDLQSALHRYTQIETELGRDPVSGLQAVVANLGLKKQDGSPVTLRDIAAHIMGQSPDQAASRQEATISRLTQTISQLQQQIGGFSQHVEQQQQQSRTASAENEWTAFQNANPRAAQLEPQIAEFLTKYPADSMSVGERLQDAYDWAASKTPNVAHTDPAPLAQTQTPTRQPNPAGQKSVSGAGGESRTVRKMSSDDAIKKAIAKLNG